MWPEVPAPALPYEYLPGLARSSAMNSCAVRTPSLDEIAIPIGMKTVGAMETKSFNGS